MHAQPETGTTLNEDALLVPAVSVDAVQPVAPMTAAVATVFPADQAALQARVKLAIAKA